MKTQASLSPREAAQRLGISLNAVYALIWAGKISAEQRQNRWYISGAAVEERLARNGRKRLSGNALKGSVGVRS
jgi:excisionase family DNA binding protein